jgi:hypothetical protein
MRCRSARDPGERTAECCRGWIAEIVGAVAALLERENIPWWADYGMLLGYQVALDQGLPPGLYWNDKDADLGALVQDRARVLALLPELAELGYSVLYIDPQPLRPWVYTDAVQVRLSSRNRTNVDLTFWHRREDGVFDRTTYAACDRYKGREVPARWIFPTARALWEGVEINVPAEPELLVAYRYGDGWRNLPAAHDDGVER